MASRAANVDVCVMHRRIGIRHPCPVAGSVTRRAKTPARHGRLGRRFVKRGRAVAADACLHTRRIIVATGVTRLTSRPLVVDTYGHLRPRLCWASPDGLKTGLFLPLVCLKRPCLESVIDQITVPDVSENNNQMLPRVIDRTEKSRHRRRDPVISSLRPANKTRQCLYGIGKLLVVSIV